MVNIQGVMGPMRESMAANTLPAYESIGIMMNKLKQMRAGRSRTYERNFRSGLDSLKKISSSERKSSRTKRKIDCVFSFVWVVQFSPGFE
jgi:hypothetical protein